MTKSLPQTHAAQVDGARRMIEVHFSDFGWKALTEAARRAGVPIEELVIHATMYYLADTPRGRFAHEVRRRSNPITGDGQTCSDHVEHPQ